MIISHPCICRKISVYKGSKRYLIYSDGLEETYRYLNVLMNKQTMLLFSGTAVVLLGLLDDTDGVDNMTRGLVKEENFMIILG